MLCPVFYCSSFNRTFFTSGQGEKCNLQITFSSIDSKYQNLSLFWTFEGSYLSNIFLLIGKCRNSSVIIHCPLFHLHYNSYFRVHSIWVERTMWLHTRIAQTCTPHIQTHTYIYASALRDRHILLSYSKSNFIALGNWELKYRQLYMEIVMCSLIFHICIFISQCTLCSIFTQ